jgi:8-oxo-dGTP diphosphatase
VLLPGHQLALDPGALEEVLQVLGHQRLVARVAGRGIRRVQPDEVLGQLDDLAVHCFHVGVHVVGRYRVRVVNFAGVILVDPDGRLLLQERDEHPRIDPEKWGLVGGHVDPGEDFEPAAYRELHEETEVVAAPGSLTLWREFEVWHETYSSLDRMQVYVAPTSLTDADIVCHEGRRIVFVEPATARALDLTEAASQVVPTFLDSDVYQQLTGS